MLKDRLQEIFEFTKSESPYRKANKGWINKDIFLDLNPSSDTLKKTNEIAKVKLFWSPINGFLSNFFVVIILGSILVFTSSSFVKGRFNFNFFNGFESKDIVSVQENKDLSISQSADLDPTGYSSQQNMDIKDLDKVDEIDSLFDGLNNENQDLINEKLDKQNGSIEDIDINKNVRILQNKKQKSNFI